MGKTVRPKTIEISDPRALRALAHPLRLELLGLLRSVGPLTATEAAERTGESAGSCSFHLRQLAKWGLIEETGTGRGRERPWRATAQLSEIPVRDGAPGFPEAAKLFSNVLADQYMRQLRAWIAARDGEPGEWQDAAATADVVLYLTAAELAQTSSAVQAVLEEAASRTQGRKLPLPGHRMVQFVFLAHPRTDLKE